MVFYKVGTVINVSGGLITKGHPIGATGIAQACEIFWQMCGKVGGDRQVEPVPKRGLSHNFGFNGGASVIVYEKADGCPYGKAKL